MEELLVKDFDGFDELYGPWFKCPKCNQSTLLPECKFCSECGQAVKWLDNYKDLIKRR